MRRLLARFLRWVLRDDASYWYSRNYRFSRPLTAQERRYIDNAFRKMDEMFAEIDKVLK